MAKRGGNAWFISDRSGMRFKIRDMVIEPGTGYMVHRSESDGRYNAVDHPQANLHKYSPPYNDPIPLMDVRPDQDWDVTAVAYLTDESGATLTDIYGSPIEVL